VQSAVSVCVEVKVKGQGEGQTLAIFLELVSKLSCIPTVGRITLSPIPPLTGVKVGEAQLVNACVFSVYSLLCTGAHMPETPLYRSVCLVRCSSDW